MQRDAIDFGRTNVSKLFIRLFVPTLLGLLFGAMLNLADGVFVGRGVGSDALAAINIAAPLFLIATGMALLFGSGVSVVAAIHLSHDNVKAARINVTQAFGVSVLLVSCIMGLMVLFPSQTAHLFGGTDYLMPLVLDYMLWIVPGLPAGVLGFVGLFVLRLDGAPRTAMGIQVAYSLLNVILDYVMVFPLHMGIKGAAMATTISQMVGVLGILYYMLFKAKTLRLYRLKFSKKSLMLTLRNAAYMARLGLSTFIGEMAMLTMMIVGNFMFVSRLGEDGVAAFSVACYLLPLVFMIGNAIAQSSLPIISYNYGLSEWSRIARARRLSLGLAAVCGLVTTIVGVLYSPLIAGVFLLGGQPAWQIAVNGFPWYSISFVFFSVNVVFIGYYQSIERPKLATLFMLLRGFVIILPAFILLPRFIGNVGLWLAVPFTELITLLVMVTYFWASGKK
ncbi:MAG: MATE family efflux transporter [Muribaculaceae bacterium]|nr:MATE family efflux transporter [Muribaculaceae bacterium]